MTTRGMTPTVDFPVPARALAIGAHPDDVEFGCGGTLAKWAAAGCTIHHLVCTDGSKGSWDPEADPHRLVMVRQEEQRAASRALGGTGAVTFLAWRDGELESGLRQRAEVCGWIRQIRPDVVLGHDPWKRYRLHPDHRHAGLLTVEGIVAARDPHFFPEQAWPAHRPGALMLWEADMANHVEDISTSIEAKLAALLQHRSQFRSTMAIDDPEATDQYDRFAARVRTKSADHGAGANLAYGEQFALLTDL